MLSSAEHQTQFPLRVACRQNGGILDITIYLKTDAPQTTKPLSGREH